MKRMVLRAKLNEDRTEAIIELWDDKKPLGHILLGAPELEGFIHQLAKHRTNMVDEVTPELDPGTKLLGIVDPSWNAPWPPLTEGRALILRHPGHGWLSFVFSDHQARAICQWLTKDRPEPQNEEKQS